MKIITLNSCGSTIIAAVIAIFFLAAIGLALAYFTSSNHRSIIQQVTSDQAFYSSLSGLEFSLGKIINEGSTDSSFTPNFAGERITVTRGINRITSIGVKGDAYNQYSIADPNPIDCSGCLVTDVSMAQVSGSNITGVLLSKKPSCDKSVIIESMSTTSWIPNTGETLDNIIVAGIDKFNGPPASSGGEMVFTAPFVINDSNVHQLNMQWNNTIESHNVSMVFNYTYDDIDYSTKSTDIQTLAGNQSDCFDWVVDVTELERTEGVLNVLKNITLKNNCAKSIRVSGLKINMTSNTPERQLKKIEASSVLFDGTSEMDETIPIDVVINASGTYPLNKLIFSEEVLGRNYIVTWYFSDGTYKELSLNLFAENQNNCLVFNVESANIPTGNQRRVEGLTIQNNCLADIGITKANLSWTGNIGMNFSDYRINDSTGILAATPNKSSGQEYDMGDGDLYHKDAEPTKSLEMLTFNQDIACSSGGTTFTLALTMSDETAKTVTFNPCGEEDIDFHIDDGEVIPEQCVSAQLQVIGAQINYSGSYDMPVTVKIKVGTQNIEPWGSFTNAITGNVNDDDNPRSYTTAKIDPNIPITVTGTSWIKKSSSYSGNLASHWKVYMTAVSNVNTTQVKVLRNGNNVPNVPGFMSQLSIKDIIDEYVANGKITLNQNEAIFLFELGTTNMSSSAADFQDLVVLLTFNSVACN